MFEIDSSWFQVDLWVFVLCAIAFAAFLVIAIVWGIRAHRRRVSAGWEELVGRTAEVKVALEPRGVVFIEGEQWTAVSESGRVKPGEEVIISKVDGLKLYVTKKQ